MENRDRITRDVIGNTGRSAAKRDVVNRRRDVHTGINEDTVIRGVIDLPTGNIQGPTIDSGHTISHRLIDIQIIKGGGAQAAVDIDRYPRTVGDRSQAGKCKGPIRPIEDINPSIPTIQGDGAVKVVGAIRIIQLEYHCHWWPQCWWYWQR